MGGGYPQEIHPFFPLNRCFLGGLYCEKTGSSLPQLSWTFQVHIPKCFDSWEPKKNRLGTTKIPGNSLENPGFFGIFGNLNPGYFGSQGHHTIYIHLKKPNGSNRKKGIRLAPLEKKKHLITSNFKFPSYFYGGWSTTTTQSNHYKSLVARHFCWKPQQKHSDRRSFSPVIV